MKHFRHLLQILLFAITLAFIIPAVVPSSGSLPGSAIEAQAASVKISAKSAVLIKGQTKTLKISGTKEKVKWSSSKKSVAAVSSKGKVTAKKKGTATITAKVDGRKYACKVTVETPKISKKTVTLIKGKTKTLKISGTTQKVKWSSSKKSVATVNSKGKVTAKKKGTATITAKVGGKKYTCKVKVETPRISQTKAALIVGDTLQLKMSGTSQTVKWSTNKKSVATVSSKGKVTAKKKGTATITAKTGGKNYTCKVTVNEATAKEEETTKEETTTVAVTSITLDKTSATLEVGEELTLSATVLPSNATNQTVTWGSSDTSVASVSSKGKVTAQKAGKATITAKIDNVQSSCTVTVENEPYTLLKDFIIANGTKSGNNYSYTYIDDSYSTLTITCSDDSDMFTFAYEYIDLAVCTASYNKDTTEISPVIEFTDTYGSCSTTTTLAKSTYYSGKSLSFTIVSNPLGLSTSLLRGYSEDLVPLNFLTTQLFLMEEVGITLQDLGFVSF